MIPNLPIIKIESLTVNSVRDFKFVFYLFLSIYHTYEIEIGMGQYLYLKYINDPHILRRYNYGYQI